MKPLLLTMGDPTGVGPEIIIRAAQGGALDERVIVVGDLAVLQRAAAVYGIDAESAAGSGLASHLLRLGSGELKVRSLSSLPAAALRYGQPDSACGRAMVEYINWACDRCLAGEAAGMVTAPINKAAVQRAGYDVPGHTELLAERCNVDKVVMMLAGSRLRVCLVTTHLPLSAVPQVLSTGEILQTVRISHDCLRRQFGLESPRIAVLSLNPHAGEEGRFGDEEQRLIEPAIERAKSEGIEASGPHSADTLFHFAVSGAYDAVVCMYHDQGLIPLKLLHFDDGVNVTLGLPIVRTSVDHGTAYDLAGTGRASCNSLVAALEMAAEMAGKANSQC